MLTGMLPLKLRLQISLVGLKSQKHCMAVIPPSVLCSVSVTFILSPLPTHSSRCSALVAQQDDVSGAGTSSISHDENHSEAAGKSQCTPSLFHVKLFCV